MSSQLDPEARDMLRVALDVERQLPRDAERVRQRLMAAVAAGATTALTATTAQAKLGAGTKLTLSGVVAWKSLAVVSALIIAAAAGYRGMTQKPTSVLTSAGQARPAAVTQAPPTPSAATLEPRAVDVEPRSREVVLTKPSRQARTDKRQPTSGSNPAAARAPQTSSAASQSDETSQLQDEAEDTATPTPNPLAEDLRWLREAQQALNTGAPNRALTLVDKIRGKQLRAEQIAVEVFAFCALGETAKAQHKAALFRSMAKGSPLLPRVNASCAKQ